MILGQTQRLIGRMDHEPLNFPFDAFLGTPDFLNREMALDRRGKRRSSNENHRGSRKVEAPLECATQPLNSVSLWRRLGAALLDVGLISSLVTLFLAVAIGIIAPKHMTWGQQLQLLTLPAAALAGVLGLVYTLLFSVLWGGSTLGARIVGIELVNAQGQRPTPGRALSHALLSFVSSALFMAGFWLALFDQHGQTLHDKLSQTFVVNTQDA